ncbi:hypothetical protein TYRP_017550 [Tyrophagus putrescentiae]|nr:hypothetical protein TYRP_017550 [Tyrophagus putrescentiae]
MKNLNNNYDNDHYHKQLTSQLQDAFVGGKPIDIRCLSAIALNWTTSSSSSSSSSSSFSSSSLLNSSSFKSPVDNLPSLPLEPPIYFDCLVNRHNLLSAVECATTAANTVPHQWALNTKGQLVKYEWRKEYLFIADPSFADHPEWICLRDIPNERSKHSIKQR